MKNVKEQVLLEVYNQVWEKIDHCSRYRIYEQVTNKVFNTVYEPVWNQLFSKVHDQIYRQIKEDKTKNTLDTHRK